MDYLYTESGFEKMMNYHDFPLFSCIRKRTDINRNIKVIEKTFSPLKDKKLLDIGCGKGSLLKALENRLALPTGIDVNKQSLTEARRRCPKAEILLTGAGEMAFDNNFFDGAIIQNTLHHIPENEIQKSLQKALGFTIPGHPVLILEPLNFGSYFEIFKPLEDETDVCQKALNQLHRFVESKMGRLKDAFEYMTYVRVNSLESIINEAISVDPRREKRARSVTNDMENLFHKLVEKQDGFLVLEQPMIAFVLTEF